MSTTSITAQSRPSTARPKVHLSFPRLMRSELMKLTTLRSPWWSIAVVASLTVALGMLATSSMASPEDLARSHVDRAAIAIQAVLAPTTFTVLLATILGCTLVTSEYSTGMMRSTLTTAPGRLSSLFSKTIVVAGFMFVTSAVVFIGTAVAITPVLAGNGVYFDLADPGTSSLPILYASLMMATIAIIGLSAGYILRNGSGAIAAAVGLVFVLPLLPRLFPQTPAWQWVHDAAQYFPTSAGGALMSSTTPGVHTLVASDLSAGVAGITLAAWAAVGLIASAIMLKFKDA